MNNNMIHYEYKQQGGVKIEKVRIFENQNREELESRIREFLKRTDITVISKDVVSTSDDCLVITIWYNDYEGKSWLRQHIFCRHALYDIRQAICRGLFSIPFKIAYQIITVKYLFDYFMIGK